MGLKAAGAGALQFVSDFTDAEAEFALMREMVRKSGRPLSFSLLQGPQAPEKWRLLLDRTAEANAQGLTIRAQVAGRPVGVLLGLELTMNPFSKNPVYREIAALPLAERAARSARSRFSRAPARHAADCRARLCALDAAELVEHVPHGRRFRLRTAAKRQPAGRRR